MKTIQRCLVLLFITYSYTVFSQTLIINEVSNGASGNQEYVEFVVVSDTVTYDCSASTPPCIDIRGWIFDDNSGYHGSSGVATGAVRFSQNTLWSCVPLGTIILLYNNADVNPAIPAADLSLTDGNCRIIAPINSNLFETNTTTPGAVACSYPGTSWTSGGNWNNTVFANPGDCARIVNLSGCEVFSVCWGSDNQNNLIYFSGSGSQKVQYFNGINPYDQSNWTNGVASPSPGAQTPGAPNNTVNESYIAQFNNNCLPITPLVASATFVNAGCTCSGTATASASGSIGSYTFEWYDASYNSIGQATATATGLCAGTYHVIVTSHINCKDTATVTLTDLSIPSITINSGTVCSGTSATIAATPSTTGGTYLWSTGATTASITVTPASTTSYSCVYTLASCPSPSVSGTVTVNPIPTITVSNATVCNGTAATITATPSAAGGTYLWNTGATTASITVSPSTTTSYSCVYTLASCPSPSVSGTVTVNPIPTITVSNATVCNGTAATITATPSTTGGTYLWNTGATIASITVSPSTTTSYSCVYTLLTCPSTSVSGTVTVNSIPTITVSNATVCDGTTTTITATPSASGGTYIWSPGGETTASINVSPSNTTSYSCVYTLASCPSPSVSGTVTVNPIPTITVSNATVCNGTAATITATPSASGGTYIWSPGGETTASINVSPSTTTSYSCVYTLLSCPSTSVSGTVTVNPIPTITVSNATVCDGTAATITVTPNASGGTYQWSPGGETTTSITVSPSATTSYSCVYTLLSCPSPSVSGTVTVNPIPTITVSNATVCNGTAATISATPSAAGGTYLWNTGATTASITVSPSTTTSYSCVYTLASCPSPSVSGTVTVNPIPTITVSNATVCNGTAASITATPSTSGGTYLWSPGGETTASITVSPSATTSYSCVYTLLSCPSPSVSGTVTVNPIPTITIPNTTICVGASGTLTATPSATGGSYLWSPGGETTNSITYSPAATTSYSCVYTLNTCPSASVSVSIIVTPSPTMTVSNTTVCNGTAGTISATPSATGGNYLWNTGETTASITASPLTTTSYTLSYTYAGCPVLNGSGTITVNPIPTITISNATVCEGTAATITATPSASGGTYLWSPGGETTASITVSPSATSAYSCIYTLNSCPSISVSGTVTVNSIPTITVSNTTICDGTVASITATPSNTGGTFLWSPGGETTASINVSPSTTTSYSCVYTLASCPSPSVSGTVTVNPIPTITVSNATECNGTAATITATPSAAGGTYLWNTGATTTSITVSPSTTTSYSCVYTLASCPSPSVSGTVTVNPIPTITVSNTTVCNGTAATITATPSTSGGTYLWSPGGETTASITVSPSATTSYSCVYTLASCPSPSVSGTITVNPIPTITVSNETICKGITAIISATPSATGGSFLWTPGGSTSQTLNLTPTLTSTYSCVYTLNGCSSTSVSGTVTVNPIPTISIADETICNGSSGSLTAIPSTNGGSFQWSPSNETTPTITNSPSTSTTYSCIYILNGCASLSTNGTINVTSAPTITVSNTTICDGNDGTILATPSILGGSYLWTPSGEITQSLTQSPSTTTSYSVTYSFPGCPDITKTGTITVKPTPTLTISNDTICFGAMASITATPSIIGGTYLWNPSANNSQTLNISPNLTTTYSCVYVVNGCQSSPNTGIITVNQIPKIVVSSNGPICEGETLNLNSTSSEVPGTSFSWSGPNFNSNIQNPTISNSTPANSGIYTVTTIANNCSDVSSINVIVNPIPIVNFEANILSGCVPLTVTFKNTTNPINGSVIWDFGDGTTSNELNNVTHTFTTANCFDIKLTSTSSGCSNNLIQNSYICANAKAFANFDANSLSQPISNPSFEFTNTSIDASTYNWNFGDGNTSSQLSPSHTYPYINDVFHYNVTLIANNANNCPDSAIITVNITDELIYYIPNTFTPDDNNSNDIFKPVFTSGFDPTDFSLLIFNRWGQIVFESHDASKGWKGTMGENGEIAQDGTYTWKIEFKMKEDAGRKMIVGHVNLLK